MPLITALGVTTLNPALETAREIVEVALSPTYESREARMLYLLDKIAFEMHVPPREPKTIGSEIPENDYDKIRDQVSKNFPGWGMYNTAASVTTNLGDADVSVGDAIDDVTDIVNDLLMVLWSQENDDEEVASWHLWDSYTNHWREHVRGIQTYSHFLHIEV